MPGDVMNRLTIVLLAGLTMLLSGIAGRSSFEGVVARSQAFANLRTAKPNPAIPTPAVAHASAPKAAAHATVQKTEAAKAGAATTPVKQIISGETPDDYVYTKPATAGARSASAATRGASTTPSVKPVGSTSRKAPSTAAPNYERAVAEATTLSADDRDRAARRLELLTSEDPERPEAFEKLAAVRLQLGDYYQAYEMYASAVRKGGKASFAVLHDHTRGNFDKGPNDTCA